MPTPRVHEDRVLTQQEKTRRWRQATNRKLAALKLATGCKDCGYNKCAEALDYDHLPNTDKLFNVSQHRKGGHGWERILKEIEKCELVCANCHRERTQLRRRAYR